MIRHDSPKDLLAWLRDRRMETNERRVGQQEYACRNRAYYMGMQSPNSGGQQSPFDRQAQGVFDSTNQRFNLQQGGPSPLRVTLNKITQNVISVQAATSPSKMVVRSTPMAGIGKPSDAVQGDVVEAIANSVIADSSTLAAMKRANFERAIDGMHGFGHRIEVTNRANGSIDLRQKAFNFDGYQLTLDPTETDQLLSNHEYVILSEVKTIHAARRQYGDANLLQIDEKKLREVGQLKPIETRYNRYTGGKMFPDAIHAAKEKGLIIHTVFLRGEDKRFDRMYVIADTTADLPNSGTRESEIVLNWDVNQGGFGNPFGGVGMPLHALYGYPRSRDLHGIADLAMMIDSQDKLNITASIYFQSIWNYVQKVIMVDRRSLADSKMDINQVKAMFDRGIVMTDMRDRASKFPQIMVNPQPPQAIANDLDRWSRDIREDGFRTDAHVGLNKSHVSDKTVERGVELAEIASEDRVNNDLVQYNSFIESLTATQIRIAQEGAPTAMRMLFEAGLDNQQVGQMLRIDPLWQLPRLKISEEAIRRRSRSQRKQDIFLLAQVGALADPTEARRLLSDMDMPIADHDRVIRQYAQVQAAQVAQGQPFVPFMLGQSASYLIEAFQRAAAQTNEPDARQRLIQAIAMQMQIEQGAQPQPQQAGEPTLEQVVNAGFNPDAVRA